MRYSDIKERYVYYVKFDPVRQCEFDGEHLAVVLKKNVDKKTLIVMPLTSKENGVGSNKEYIKIDELPERLKKNKSYAVYDKVRSVNYKRCSPVYKNTSGKEQCDVKVDDILFVKLLELAKNHIEETLTLDEKLVSYRQELNKLINEKVINLAYSIKKSKDNEDNIKSLENEIRGIIDNKVKLTFSDTDKEAGIENIINGILGI